MMPGFCSRKIFTGYVFFVFLFLLCVLPIHSAEPPDWWHDPNPGTAELVYEKGSSRGHSSESDARQAAFDEALAAVRRRITTDSSLWPHIHLTGTAIAHEHTVKAPTGLWNSWILLSYPMEVLTKDLTEARRLFTEFKEKKLSEQEEKEKLAERKAMEDANFARGLEFFRVGEYEKALEAFKELKELNPARADAQLYIARAEIQIERTKRGEPLFEEFKLEPKISMPSRLKEGSNWTSPAAGKEFVWIEQMRMWVGRYEVTNAEYRKKEPGHDSGDYEGHTLNRDRQPVVGVNFNDAKAYAEWMTDRDGGVLPQGYRYRLPSGREWMTFVQCGNGREYPWGNNWPPVSGRAGNYADEAAKRGHGDTLIISGYNDGFAVTAPVDELWVNPWGLSGVGGNVWEITASDSSGALFGAWRGASWGNRRQGYLRCSRRGGGVGSYRGNAGGFRLVLSR